MISSTLFLPKIGCYRQTHELSDIVIMIKSLVYYTAFTYLAYNLSLVAYKCYLFSQRYDLDYSEIKRPVSETCDVGLEHVRIIDNVRSFKQADDIIEENPWQPVLFKNFLDDAPTRWNEIYEEHKDTVLTFSKMKTKAFGNLYQSGAVKIMDKVEQKLSDYLDNSFKGNANETLYAAFLELPRSSVRGNSENDIFQNARVDQAFLSNFKEDILGTPLHAAPATQSYTLQYTGKKMWLFVSPKDMDSLDVMNFPSTVPLAGSEKDFFLKKVSMPYACSFAVCLFNVQRFNKLIIYLLNSLLIRVFASSFLFAFVFISFYT